jgi:hypothetical protein
MEDDTRPVQLELNFSRGRWGQGKDENDGKKSGE